MEFFLFLAILYVLKAAVIMLDRKSLIEKSQFFNISYHLPEMNNTPADTGVFSCRNERTEDPDRSGKNGIREVVGFCVEGGTVFPAADIENGAGTDFRVPAEIF